MEGWEFKEGTVRTVLNNNCLNVD